MVDYAEIHIVEKAKRLEKRKLNMNPKIRGANTPYALKGRNHRTGYEFKGPWGHRVIKMGYGKELLKIDMKDFKIEESDIIMQRNLLIIDDIRHGLFEDSFLEDSTETYLMVQHLEKFLSLIDIQDINLTKESIMIIIREEVRKWNEFSYLMYTEEEYYDHDFEEDGGSCLSPGYYRRLFEADNDSFMREMDDDFSMRTSQMYAKEFMDEFFDEAKAEREYFKSLNKSFTPTDIWDFWDIETGRKNVVANEDAFDDWDMYGYWKEVDDIHQEQYGEHFKILSRKFRAKSNRKNSLSRKYRGSQCSDALKRIHDSNCSIYEGGLLHKRSKNGKTIRGFVAIKSDLREFDLEAIEIMIDLFADDDYLRGWDDDLIVGADWEEYSEWPNKNELRRQEEERARFFESHDSETCYDREDEDLSYLLK